MSLILNLPSSAEHAFRDAWASLTMLSSPCQNKVGTPKK